MMNMISPSPCRFLRSHYFTNMAATTGSGLCWRRLEAVRELATTTTSRMTVSPTTTTTTHYQHHYEPDRSAQSLLPFLPLTTFPSSSHRVTQPVSVLPWWTSTLSLDRTCVPQLAMLPTTEQRDHGVQLGDSNDNNNNNKQISDHWFLVESHTEDGGTAGVDVVGWECMNRNARRGKRANHGKRPCSRQRRRSKRRAFGNHRR